MFDLKKITSKKLIIICGHFGTGKTNIAINLAVKLKSEFGEDYMLADLDTVNPFFRSSDNKTELEKMGINCITPEFANTNVDIPSIPSQIYSIFVDNKKAVLDIGGDETGSTVLGTLSERIKLTDYEMIYVVNKYRNMIQKPGEALALAYEIEKKSNLKITSVVNNSHTGEFTDIEYVRSSFSYADEISKSLKKPLFFTSVTENIIGGFAPDEIYEKKLISIKNYTKKIYI